MTQTTPIDGLVRRWQDAMEPPTPIDWLVRRWQDAMEPPTPTDGLVQRCQVGRELRFATLIVSEANICGACGIFRACYELVQ